MFGTKETIIAAKELLRLRKDYTNPPKRERELDPLFYAYLKGHCKVSVSRQKNIYFTGSKKPWRIDYRIGGSNPSLIELAVRPPNGTQELTGPSNLKELKKLSKIPTKKAKRRILLLLDLKKTAIAKHKLIVTYAPLNSGPGQKPRHPVTVIYVHANTSYSFPWSPYKG